MRRKIASLVLVLGVLPFLLGMGGDQITEKNVTPNPGGKPQTVDGNGTYQVGVNNGKPNKRVLVLFSAENTVTSQLSSNSTNYANGKWDGTLQVVAGNYDCWGIISSMDATTGTTYTTESNKINVNVK